MRLDDLREKIVALIIEASMKCNEFDCSMEFCPYHTKGDCKEYLIADHLIANGVTVQEWILASDPPKDDLPVLVTCGRGYRPFVARYDLIWKRWKVSHTLKITHWQPLPGTSNLPESPGGREDRI